MSRLQYLAVYGIAHVGTEAGRTAVSGGPVCRDGAQRSAASHVEGDVFAKRLATCALELHLPVNLVSILLGVQFVQRYHARDREEDDN